MDQLNVAANGYPLNNDTARHLNRMTQHPTEALALAMGDNTIVSGIVDDGTNITAGYVVIAGELLPFRAGASQPNVEVIEEVTNGFYDDGTTVSRPVRTVRYARATASGSLAISSFTRLLPLQKAAQVETIGEIAIIKPINQPFTAVWNGSIIDVAIGPTGIRTKLTITIPEVFKDYIPVVEGINLGPFNSIITSEINDVTSTTFDYVIQGVAPHSQYFKEILIKTIS
jgi:hypothetical protein